MMPTHQSSPYQRPHINTNQNSYQESTPSSPAQATGPPKSFAGSDGIAQYSLTPNPLSAARPILAPPALCTTEALVQYIRDLNYPSGGPELGQYGMQLNSFRPANIAPTPANAYGQAQQFPSYASEQQQQPIEHQVSQALAIGKEIRKLDIQVLVACGDHRQPAERSYSVYKIPIALPLLFHYPTDPVSQALSSCITQAGGEASFLLNIGRQNESQIIEILWYVQSPNCFPFNAIIYVPFLDHDSNHHIVVQTATV